MAVEDVEKALDLSRQFVDIGNILADFSNNNLTPEEQQEAAHAIHVYRLQEVVTLAGSVLLNKKDELLEKRASLLGEISLIDDQLVEIESSMTDQFEITDDSLFDEVRQTVNQRFLNWNGLSHTELLNEAEKVEPFVLTIPVRDASRWVIDGIPTPDFSLIEWVRPHSEFLEKICGRWSKNSFTRIAYSFARTYSSQERLDNLIAVNDMGTGEVMHDDNNAIAYKLIVNKPREFMYYLLNITNVGTKSATAMFCIADIQRLKEAS